MAVGGRWVSGRVKTGRPCCARGDDVFGACAPLSPDGDSFARNKRKSAALICLKPYVPIPAILLPLTGTPKPYNLAAVRKIRNSRCSAFPTQKEHTKAGWLYVLFLCLCSIILRFQRFPGMLPGILPWLSSGGGLSGRRRSFQSVRLAWRADGR